MAEAEQIEAQLRQQVEAAPPIQQPSIEQTLNAVQVAPVPAPPVEPSPAPAPPAPQPAPPPPVDTTDWRQKFLSLQGIFNTEMPKMQQQVRDMSDRLTEAERARETRQAPPQEDPKPSEADVEKFGGELVSMVSRVAERMFSGMSQVVDSRLRSVEAAIAKLEPTVIATAQTSTATAEETFFNRLEKLVPNWQQTNQDPAFLSWLAEADPVYGVQRQVALNTARQSLDANRAASVFNAFAKLTAAPAAAPTPSPMAQHQAPVVSGGSTPPTPTEQPVFTEKQISAFYNDVARGRYRGREADQQRIENAINAAAREGRIKPY
jgi:hypothetical protein